MAEEEKTVDQITLKDYATGKPIKNNPEEAFRQEFEHMLIDDLGYPKGIQKSTSISRSFFSADRTETLRKLILSFTTALSINRKTRTLSSKSNMLA